MVVAVVAAAAVVVVVKVVVMVVAMINWCGQEQNTDSCPQILPFLSRTLSKGHTGDKAHGCLSLPVLNVAQPSMQPGQQP